MFEIKFVAVQCDGDAAEIKTNGEIVAVDLEEISRQRWEIKGVLSESSIEGFSHTLMMQRVLADERWLNLEQAMRAGFRLTCSYHKNTNTVRILAELRKRARIATACVERTTLAEALLELPIQGYLT